MDKMMRGRSEANAPPNMTVRFRGPPEFAKRRALEHLWTIQSSSGFFTRQPD
jgi:hypothetical protein